MGSQEDAGSRAAREKRLEDLAVRVVAAIHKRDAAVADAERRAGETLREMTEHEGLSLREALEWCGDGTSAREARRLRRLAEDDHVAALQADVQKSAAGTAEGRRFS